MRSEDDVRAAVTGVDIVFHLAAWTDVDGCEADPQKAWAVNATGTENVARAARAEGARVIYLSTDYVFDGSKAGPYLETDPPAPLNAYGRSKLAGEESLDPAMGDLVVSTSWVYGDGRNFVRTIEALGRTKDTIDVVNDQHGRPTCSRELAASMVTLAGKGADGIVNLTGAGVACTWWEIAEEVLSLTKSRSIPVPTTSLRFAEKQEGSVAPRPANSVLSLDKAASFGVRPTEWRDSLRSFLGVGS